MKNTIKMFGFITILFSCVFSISNVEAKENTNITFTGKMAIESMEKLKEVNPTLYGDYLKYKETVHRKCSAEFGEDNYYYLIEKQSRSRETDWNIIGGSYAHEDYFNGYCYKKGTNEIEPYLYAMIQPKVPNMVLSSKLFESSSNKIIYNHSYSDYWDTDNEAGNISINDLQLGRNVTNYMESNISFRFIHNHKIDNESYYTVDSFTVNGVTYKDGDVIINNNSMHNPDLPPVGANTTYIGWGSDFYKYEYFAIDPSLVFDDVYFELDDGGNRKIDRIQYMYIEKDKPDSEAKYGYIESHENRFFKRFPKSFFSNLRHFSIKIYYPYQVQNYNYEGYWYNSFYKDENGEIVDIFNSHESIKRGKYVEVDLTDKYAVQLIFKRHVDPQFDFLEFHALGSFNYYFKKNYGQSNTTYDNSSFDNDNLGLVDIYFDDLKYITIDEINSNLSLFFVNKNFNSPNRIRTLLKYDSDMFDIVIFDNEWDDKVIQDSNGNNITLSPPVNIKPDGSVDNGGGLLDGLTVENIIESASNSIKSLFKVFNLMGNLCTVLFTSLPPVFQTVLIFGFVTGVIIVVLKIML